jgi:hypothetical protein
MKKNTIEHLGQASKKVLAAPGRCYVAASTTRSRTIIPVHQKISKKFGWYEKWHLWSYRKINHQHIHWAVAIFYMLVLSVFMLLRSGVVFAADFTDSWNFSSISSFLLDSEVEQDGSTVSLKSQEYSTDGNTSALFHFNESAGSSADDSSSNNNDLITTGLPGFVSGNLNNALNFDGNLQRAVATDSTSLSITGQLSLEAWIKPNSPFTSSSSQTQMIIDKGSYRLGLDRTSGKAFYEVENNNSEQWTKRLGEDQAGSWSFNHSSVDAATSYNSDIYVGTGYIRGDAEVWKWNGSTWSKVGGDGVNSSWADQTYEKVYSMITNGTSLYVGLGDTVGDAEVWTCNVSTGCTAWTKIAGDGIGISGGYQTIQSMNIFGGTLYIGTGTTVGNGDVYKYNGGTSWTQVGGDALNLSWAASTYESVQSLTSDGIYLYAGIGLTANDAEVWRYNGTSWVQIGGDSFNSSWASGFEGVYSLNSFGGNVYAGLGNNATDAQVWKWNGTTWVQIAGAGVPSTWNTTNHTTVYSMANDGTNLYASLGSGSAAAEVWKYNGTSWTQIGGDSLNGSWATSISNALVWANSKLYSSAWTTGTYGSAYWEYNGSNWTVIGGQYLNGSWGGHGITRVVSSTTHNGKAYFGLGSANNTALVYEYDGTTATLVGGSGKSGSWDAWAYEQVSTMTSYNGELYVGLGSNGSDAEVWKYNGSTWSKVAGDGVNSTWNNGESQVSSMAVYQGRLYVGLGAVNYHADIWELNGSAWTQVAGEPGSAIGAGVEINGSWKSTPIDVQALTVWDNKLCAGVAGNSLSQVWCWSGSGNWALVGGGWSGVSTNGSWVSNVNQYIGSLAVYNGKLLAGFGTTTGHIANIWEFDGTTWTQIGGTDINGSWSDSAYTFIKSQAVYNGKLYVGMGTTGSSSPMGDVWCYDGASWSQVGGDGINNSWPVSQGAEEVNTLLNYRGKLYAGLGFSAGADPVVYSFGNNAYVDSSISSFTTSWQHLAASYDGVNMKIYINGVQDASVAVAATGADNSSPLQIGNGYGSGQAGDGQAGFAGQVDEVRISNIARTNFTAKPYSASEQSITLSDPVRLSGIASWVGFSANEAANGGAIAYRLSSDDGATWKYWNGGAWSTSSGLNQASSASDINAHIDAFPVTFQGLRWQAVLKGDGTQKVTLNSVEVTSDADVDAPSLNASSLQAFSSNGGTQISGGSWTNVVQPYFSWSSASDALSDIYGYCLYLGQTPSENPVTSKGLLGSSPVETGGHCQYVVSSTSLDLSQAGVLATPLSTSNSSYYLNIRAIDSAGNVSGSSEQFEFKFDNTAPANPSYITAPSEFVSSKEVTFTWPTSGGDAAADDHSLVAGLQYKIGTNGAWRGDGVGGAGNLANDGSYTTRNDPDYPDINNGNNVFYFRTIDNAGNVSASYVSATLRLNTGAPTGPQNLIATPSSNTSNSFAFSWSPPASFAGSANSLTYCYTINTLPTANTCTYTSAGVTSLPASAYATQPGDNTFYVVAKDNNINYATATSTTFTANTSAPGMPLDLEIADISTKATSSWKVALSWSEPTDVGAGVSSYKVFRSNTDSNYVQIASTAGSSFVDSGLSQQTYYYKVKACDSANNCGALSSSVSKYPTGRFTTPANITSNPTVSAISTRKATIRWSTDRVSDSKVSIGTTAGQYEPFQIASGDQVTDHSVQMTNLTPGTTYFVKASWTDEDGNTGNSSEFTFQTEPAPSTQEVITTRVGLNSAQIRLTSISAARVVIQYGKSDSFGGVKEISTSLARSTYDVELTGLDDNTKYYYRLNTYDADGNEYIGSTVLTFTTPARPHISDLRFEPVSGEPTSTQRVTWVTNVDTTSGVIYGKDGTNGSDVLNSTLTRNHEVIIRGLDDNSIYFLLAQSRDVDGNLAVSERQSFQTALDTRPPVIKDLAVETVVKGTGSDARGQIIVTWTTDEPSTSQVAFGEGTSTEGVTSMTTEDANLTTEHVVIVSDLSTARVYNVQAVSRDKARNEAKSDSQATIINRGTDSILSIIVNVLQQIFGFEAK